MAERNRECQAKLEGMQALLATVGQEIANIMKAIRQGILTPTTKLEPQKVEAEGRTCKWT